jgi:hypothetical protein
MSTTVQGMRVALVLIVIEPPGPGMPSVQQEYKIFTAPYFKPMLTRRHDSFKQRQVRS